MRSENKSSGICGMAGTNLAGRSELQRIGNVPSVPRVPAGPCVPQFEEQKEKDLTGKEVTSGVSNVV